MADEIERAQAAILGVFRPLIAGGRPVALVDFGAGASPGDYAIWLGEKALLQRLGARLVYQCSASLYDPEALAAALGSDGVVCFQGGASLGDAWSATGSLRHRVLADFPNHDIVVFPQSVRFFAEAAIETSVAAVARHGRVALVARDVLSHHLLSRRFGDVARVAIAPDLAFMIGPAPRSGAPCANVVWIGEQARGARLAQATGLQAQSGAADLGAFGDGVAVSVTSEVVGAQLLASDWNGMTVSPEGLDAYRQHGFDQRAAFWVERALRLLSAGQVVITDRLDGHILCTLAGVPHVLQADGDAVAYFETWSRPSDLCRLAASPRHAWALAQELLAQHTAPSSAAAATPLDQDAAQVAEQIARRAAHHIAAGARVLDVGDAAARLEPHLPEDAVLAPRPSRPGRAADRPSVVAALGALEQLDAPETLWAEAANKRLILSYPVRTPALGEAGRRARGWRNDFSRAELLSAADHAGLTLVAEEPFPPDTILFVFDPGLPNPPRRPATAPASVKPRAKRRPAGQV